jgi:ABC-type multidrug transport system fused ATPase/permease subunit
MSAGLVIKFLGTITDLLLPFILAHIIDEVVPTENVPLIVLWGVMMIVCSVICMAGNVIANRMASAVARDASRALRHDLFSSFQVSIQELYIQLDQPYQFYDSHGEKCHLNHQCYYHPQVFPICLCDILQPQTRRTKLLCI